MRMGVGIGCAVACCLAFAAPAMGMGTPALVRDINPGPDDSGPSFLAPFDGRLYFSASDGTSGYELWSSDGATSGTSLLKDIFPGPESSYPSGMTDAFGELIFRATDDLHGTEPWSSDGTAVGTAMAIDLRPGTASSFPSGLALADDRTFFQADDGATGNELWLYEGADATRVKDVDPAPGSSGVQGGTVIAIDDTAYFGGNDGTGLKLWKSDGTATGTVPVSDDVFVTLRPLLAWDGKLFFAGLTVGAGTELWVSDGTDAGTKMVEDVYPGSNGSLPEQMVDVDGTVLFAASDGTHGRELWRTDGTAAGTELVEDINTGSMASMASEQAYFVAIGDTAYFAAGDGAHGRELWRTDGTAAGTELVEDIRPGTASSYPAFLTPIDGGVFFTADDGAHGDELWRMDDDGTDADVVADIAAGAMSSIPGNITQVGSDVFFTAQTAAAGRELWRLQLDVSPVAVGDSGSVIEDAPATAVNVLGNDTDVDGGPRSIGSVTQPTHGEVAVTGPSALTYEPDPDFCTAGSTTDDFTYELSPGGNAATVKMAVTCVDDPSNAVDDVATVPENAAATAVNVLGNDTDVDGGPRSIGSVTQPAHGQVAIADGGSGLTYRPDTGYCNVGATKDGFTYEITPGGDTAAVAMTVTCADDPPSDPPDTVEHAGFVVANRIASVRKGIVQLGVRCRGEGPCKGRVTLAVTRRAGKRTVRVVLGTKLFAIPAGKTKTLRIGLNRAGRSRLAKSPSGRLQVKLGGSGVKPRTVTLKLQGG